MAGLYGSRPPNVRPHGAVLVDDEEWSYPTHHDYQGYMTNCMSYAHGRSDNPYPREKTFTKQELLQLTPSVIRQWLNLQAYGDPFPHPRDRPVFMRSGSLKKAKQAVSHFMPNKHVPWMDGRGGNPTRHRSILELISRVATFEVRGEGVAANDKRAYNQNEFNMMLQLFLLAGGFDNAFKFVLMSLWAYHLIHRLDDTCHFKVSAPHGSHSAKFPFAIYTRTKWSKNVRGMRNCPDQVLFGAGDFRNCPQLWLSLYLEIWLVQHPHAKFLFTNNDHLEKGPDNLNQQYANRVRKLVWDKAEFKRLEDQVGDEDDRKGLGTHSLRKYAATRARRKGATRVQGEFRGRWVGEKSGSVMGMRYEDPNDEFTDAFVAGCLCEGGPIKYAVRKDLAISDDFLFHHCIPNIRKRYGNDLRFCRVMALARLWCAFDPQARSMMPEGSDASLRFRFEQKYGGQSKNPVEKIGLVIANINGHLEIFESVSQLDQDTTTPSRQQRGMTTPNTAAAAGGRVVDLTSGNEVSDLSTAGSSGGSGGSGGQSTILAFLSNIEKNMTQRFDTMQNNQENHRQWCQQQFARVNNNQRRYGGTIGQAFVRGDPQEQARRRNHAAESTVGASKADAVAPRLGTIDPSARLIERPRSLMELWEEFIFGIGDNKAAKSFTTLEKNNRMLGIKQKYYRRSKVWKLQAYLVNAGNNIQAVNAKILRVYQGDGRVTRIIDRIIADGRDQRNPYVKAVGFRIDPQLCAEAI